MKSTPIIYGSIISPYVRKVVITLNKKKIPFELKPMSPFGEADKKFLLTLNPLGKVPVYQEGDFILSDSSAICAYLEKSFPEPAIFPKNNQEYAKSLWFEEYADSQLIPAIGTVFLNTVLAPVLNRPVNHELVKTNLESTIPGIFEYLNKELIDRKYLVGDQLSIADISIGQLALIKYDFLDFKIDTSKWKSLAAYLDNITKDDVFNNVFVMALERLNHIRQKK